MRVTVVGSGTLVPDPARVSASVWFDTGAHRGFVDLGWGALRRAESLGLPWADVDLICLTHFHADHLGDLASLLLALSLAETYGRERRTRALRVLGPVGLGDRITALAAAFGDRVRSPGFPLLLEELVPGGDLEAGDVLPPELRYAPTAHTDASLAYRWDSRHGSWAVTGDTGPDPVLADFVAGVDLLVTECSGPDREVPANHQGPADVAELLARAAPAMCLLTHTYPPHSPDRLRAEIADTGYAGVLESAVDGSTVVWTSEGPNLR